MLQRRETLDRIQAAGLELTCDYCQANVLQRGSDIWNNGYARTYTDCPVVRNPFLHVRVLVLYMKSGAAQFADLLNA